MTAHYYAIIWIDHREAKIFHLNSIDVDRLIIRPHDPTRHIHRNANPPHKPNSIASGDVPSDHEFFEQVAEAIDDAKAVLITGPASAKSELATHITRCHPDVAGRVVGVETIDHPGDGAFLALARIYFKAEDR
jgi:stalled ribosome rescue protein Dom34